MRGYISRSFCRRTLHECAFSGRRPSLPGSCAVVPSSRPSQPIAVGWRRRSSGPRRPPLPRAASRSVSGPEVPQHRPATMGGRVDDLAVLESNPAVFYVGTATGGLWKTINNGTTWDVLFDDLDDVVSIGDIAINPNDANTVWVGTGENNNRQSGSWGNGVYKSIDGGQTWKHMGLRDSKHIARIIVDPIDHDVVYVAALGSLWGRGGERGVYKTTDGGLTWTSVLFVDDDTGATELVMDPVEQQGALRRDLSAPPRHLGLQRRRPRQRDVEVERRRPHLDEADQRRPAGPARPHRHGRLPRQPEHPLRAHRAREGKRHLSLGRRRPDVAEDVERQSAADVLQPDPHRSRTTICASTCSACRFTSPTTAARRSSRTARCTRIITRCGSTRRTRITSSTAPTAASASARTRARPGKAIYNMDLGQFYHVTYDMETPYNVCGGLQDNYTWCGPTRGAQPHRHRQRRVVPDPRRRRLRGADRSEELAHHLRRVAGRQHRRASTRSPTSASRSGRCRRAASRRCAGTGTRRS